MVFSLRQNSSSCCFTIRSLHTSHFSIPHVQRRYCEIGRSPPHCRSHLWVHRGWYSGILWSTKLLSTTRDKRWDPNGIADGVKNSFDMCGGTKVRLILLPSHCCQWLKPSRIWICFLASSSLLSATVRAKFDSAAACVGVTPKSCASWREGETILDNMSGAIRPPCLHGRPFNGWNKMIAHHVDLEFLNMRLICPPFYILIFGGVCMAECPIYTCLQLSFCKSEKTDR